MKRVLIFSVLCPLLCLTLGLRGVDAQESQVDVTKWITLTVKEGAKIKLDFAAAAGDVWVKVTGVNEEKDEKASTALTTQREYKATGSTLTVYGAIEAFSCSFNYMNLTALDVSKNGDLKKLDCSNNRLSMLDVSHCVNLTTLSCNDNQLSSLDVAKDAYLTNLNCSNNPLSRLDVSNCVHLTTLWCNDNPLSTLDVSKNINLIKLFCNNNQLSSLDVSENVNLTMLTCVNNQLSSLDVSKNVLLEQFWIYGNPFSTSSLNNLYCQLPNRTGKQRQGMLYLVNKSGDTEERLVQSSSKAVTDAKNWKIKYWFGNSEINSIMGQYNCGSTYALTLTPATLSHTLAYLGETWETTVTSTGEWKIDESTLPAWLSVSPQQGNSGTKVTVTAQLNMTHQVRDAALTFVLTHESTTEQVVLLRQKPKPPILVTPAEECTFPVAGETKTNYFTVESTQEWTVTSSATWCAVEPNEGEAGTKQVTVKAEANNEKEAREADLTFALKANAAIQQVVKVKQEGNSITVTPAEECTFPVAGETKTNYFTVESTAKWTVTSSATWCTVEPNEGNAGTMQVTVKAEANTGKEAREAELTFTLKANAAIQQVVKVKQGGNSITVTPAEECTFPVAGETKTNYFTVESTQEWTVTSSAAWCTVEPNEGEAGTMQATVKAEANNEKEARQAELTFTLKANAAIQQVVKVKQGGNSITVTPAEECTFPVAGETKTNYFTVESTQEWTVTSSATWCTVEPNAGNAGTMQATVKAEANTGKEAREADLTFALKANAAIQQVVKVKQGGNSITVTPVEEYTFPVAGETKTNYFTVESTQEWTVTSSAAWCTVEPNEGNAGTMQATVKAEANTGKEARQAELTFTLKANAAIRQVVKVKQGGNSITVTPAEECTFLVAGETKTNYFTVESTQEWTVTSSAAWCTVEPNEGEAGTKQVTVKAEANTGKEAREADLTFALKANAAIQQVVKVRQGGNSITVTPAEECTFPVAGETKTNYFTVESTQEWTVTSSAAWCTVEPNEGEAGTKQVTVKAEANTGKEAREADLTFALKANAAIQQVVKVKQEGTGKNSTAVEDALLADVYVAPNPFTVQLIIKKSEGIKGRYELVSANGVTVRSGSLQGSETVLRTEALRSGVYLLRILSGESVKTFNVVKE